MRMSFDGMDNSFSINITSSTSSQIHGQFMAISNNPGYRNTNASSLTVIQNNNLPFDPMTFDPFNMPAFIPDTTFVAISSDSSAITGYSVTQVSAVPLPPAVLMFASGLLGLGAFRKKKAQA